MVHVYILYHVRTKRILYNIMLERLIIQRYICIYFCNIISVSLKWFGKRFLHPDVISIYEYIFLLDDDLGVEYLTQEGITDSLVEHLLL